MTLLESIPKYNETFTAWYNADKINYNDKEVKITPVSKKAVVTLESYEFYADYTGSLISFTPVVVYNGSKVSPDDYTLWYAPIGETSKIYTGFTVNYESGKSVDNGCIQNNNSSIDIKSIGFTDGGTWKPTVYLSSQNYQMADTEITIKIRSVVLSTYHNTLYNIDDALDNATSGEIIIVKENTYMNQNVEIEAGVSLVVPYDDTLNTAQMADSDSNLSTNNGVYRLLTISKNTTLTLSGILNVAGRQARLSSNYTSHTTGDYGCIQLEDDAKISMNSDSELYAWGYIKGSGTVLVNSDAKVFEPLQVKDWPGGTIGSKIYDKIFPFSQFLVANIESKMIVFHKGTVTARFITIVSKVISINQDIVMFGPNTDSLFQINDGSITKEVKDGKVIITMLNGKATTNNLKVKISGLSMSTEGKEIPICGYYSIIIDGGELSVGSVFKLLPGALFKISNLGTCTITSAGGIIGYPGNYNSVLTKEGNNQTSYGGNRSRTDVSNSISGYESGSTVEIIVDGSLDVEGKLGGNISTTHMGASIELKSSASINNNTFTSHINITEKKSWGLTTTDYNAVKIEYTLALLDSNRTWFTPSVDKTYIGYVPTGATEGYFVEQSS